MGICGIIIKYNKLKIMIDPINTERETSEHCLSLLKWKREKYTVFQSPIYTRKTKLLRIEIGIKTFSDYQLVSNFISRNSELKEKIERMLCVECKTYVGKNRYLGREKTNLWEYYFLSFGMAVRKDFHIWLIIYSNKRSYIMKQIQEIDTLLKLRHDIKIYINGNISHKYNLLA